MTRQPRTTPPDPATLGDEGATLPLLAELRAKVSIYLTDGKIIVEGKCTKPEQVGALIDLLRLLKPLLPANESTNAQRPSKRDVSTNGEPSPEVGPQAEASLAGTGTGTPAGQEGRSEGAGASDESAALPASPDLTIPNNLLRGHPDCAVKP